MLQYTYTAETLEELEGALAKAAQDEMYQQANQRVLIVFEPSCDKAHFEQLAAMTSRVLPDALSVGMTTLKPLVEDLRAQTSTVATLLLLERSEARLFSYNCHDVTPRDAGDLFVASTRSIRPVKGVLFMSSCARLWPAAFIDAIANSYPSAAVFGAQAGMECLANDESLVMANGTVYDRGILALAFGGEDLHINTDFNMGFRPAGREFQVTRSRATGFVDDIDEAPAVRVYERFLGVKPDESFYENICAFPLLVSSKSLLVPCTPLDFTPDGRLQFSMDLARDARLMISYSTPEYLLEESLASANSMARFSPQGLLVFSCLNRRVFLGNDRADREISYYGQVNGSYCWSCGYNEVLRTSDGGGIMNSSLIAMGLREGPAPETDPSPVTDSLLGPRHDAPAPYEKRLVKFLEAVMSEMRGTIDGLAVLAERDQLTGLYNRRRMDELLSYEISRLHDNETFALLMFDIDHFKQVNDTYGHEVGDIVLKEIAQCISDVTRAHDILSRWGGEEFVCLAMHASLEQACGLAERIRHHIHCRNFTKVGHLTVSIGVANATKTDTIRTLFNRADAALYDAKNSGRNCVRSRAVE